MYKQFSYDTTVYPFRDYVSSVFDTGDLEHLHEKRKDLLPEGKLNFENETKTKFHSTFYDRLNDGWEEIMDLYRSFVWNAVSEHVDEDQFLYQYFPSFRVHLPGDQAIHKWHYDSDDDHRHPDGEINFCIAITEMFDSNTIWLESEPGAKDFYPMEASYGQCTRFNGNKCVHGNKMNETDQARISFDFRVLPMSKYHPEKNTASVTANKKFIDGGYYRMCNVRTSVG